MLVRLRICLEIDKRCDCLLRLVRYAAAFQVSLQLFGPIDVRYVNRLAEELVRGLTLAVDFAEVGIMNVVAVSDGDDLAPRLW